MGGELRSLRRLSLSAGQLSAPRDSKTPRLGLRAELDRVGDRHGAASF